MHPIDAGILFAFIVYAAASGLRARRTASRNLEEYFLAGRSLSGWQAGISMAATQFAADTPLLVTGLVATAGIFSLWRLWIYAIAFLLLGFVLAPSWRRASVLTDAELTELRYANVPLRVGRLRLYPAAILRGVKAVYFGTIFNCTVLAMVLFAAKEITEPFLPWNLWLPAGVFEAVRSTVEAVGVPIARTAAGGPDVWVRSANNVLSIFAIVGVTTLYSATGGLRSVVRTDVVQFAIMMAGTMLYAGWVVHAGGGMEGIVEAIHQRFSGPPATPMTAGEILAFTPSRAYGVETSLLAVFALQWLVQMNADGTGYLAQRAMACRSDRDARLAAVVFTGAQILLRSLLWLPIALGLLVLFPPAADLDLIARTAEREATFVLGIKALLPPGIIGLMLTAMLAALASTVDTHLNWGASYWTNDIYKRFVCRAWLGVEPSQRSLVWVARASNLLILGIALAVMTQLGSIQTAWKTSLLLGAGMGVMLVLRWLWWRINAWGEIATILASSLLAPLLLHGVASEAWRLLIMAVAATAAGIFVSLGTGNDPLEHLRRFYARARPPGFWKPVAIAEGERDYHGPAVLARRLVATAAAALSVFALLTGTGTWLVEGTPPAWLPSREAWIGCNLAVGIALIPVWWRLGFREAVVGGTSSHPRARSRNGPEEDATVGGSNTAGIK